MKYLSEYRNLEETKKVLDEIHKITTREWNIMEICGGQTHSLVKNGILELLPEKIKVTAQKSKLADWWNKLDQKLFTKAVAVEKEEDILELEKYCFQKATKFDYFGNNWIFISDQPLMMAILLQSEKSWQMEFLL